MHLILQPVSSFNSCSWPRTWRHDWTTQLYWQLSYADPIFFQALTHNQTWEGFGSLRYRCSTLRTELSRQLGAIHAVSSIWNIMYLKCGKRYAWRRNWSLQLFSNTSITAMINLVFITFSAVQMTWSLTYSHVYLGKGYLSSDRPFRREQARQGLEGWTNQQEICTNLKTSHCSVVWIKEQLRQTWYLTYENKSCWIQLKFVFNITLIGVLLWYKVVFCWIFTPRPLSSAGYKKDLATITNLLAFYCQCRSLSGSATHYSVDTIITHLSCSVNAIFITDQNRWLVTLHSNRDLSGSLEKLADLSKPIRILQRRKPFTVITGRESIVQITQNEKKKNTELI